MTNSISKCNKTKTKSWKSSITKINTSKNWNKNALPRTLAFEVWRTKNIGFWGLKNLLLTQLSQLAPSQAASIHPAAPWLLPNPRPIHSQIKHIVGQLLPISLSWNPKLKPKTLNKKTTKNQPNHLNLNLNLLIVEILTQLNNSSEISLVSDSSPRLSTHSPTRSRSAMVLISPHRASSISTLPLHLRSQLRCFVFDLSFAVSSSISAPPLCLRSPLADRLRSMFSGGERDIEKRE